jgi:predicted permease
MARRWGGNLRFWERDLDAEVEEEFRFHLEAEVEELTARGATAEAAREAALRRFGDLARFRAECRRSDARRAGRARRADWLGALRQDLRLALRSFRRQPRFVGAAVLTVAVGIAANAGIFSIVRGVLLEPLPFPEPQRLVRIWETNPAIDDFSASDPNFLDWRAQSRSFARLAAFRGTGFELAGAGEPLRVTGLRASADLLPLLGARPRLGRVFTAAEDTPGGDTAVAVVSEGFWRRHLGADPAAVGRALELDDQAHVVVGVLGPEFAFGEVEVVVPLVPDPAVNRGHHTLAVVGRLAPGVALEQARAEMEAIAGRLAAEYPDSNRDWGVRLATFQDWLIGPEFTRRVLVLQGAVICVLLLACANVANLMLARAAGRRGEMGMRAALGAGRGRLLRQLLTESLVLAALGGAVGVVLAWGGLALLRRLGSVGIPRPEALSLDGAVVAGAALASLLTGLAFGAAPALRLSRARLDEVGGRRAGERRRRWDAALVAVQVALAMVLLTGAGLLGRSFARLQEVELGFTPERVLTARLSLPARRYPPARIVAFQRQLVERLAALPGVEAAALTNIAPFLGGNTSIPVRRERGAEGDFLAANWRAVTPGYFAALEVPIRRGRGLEASDGEEASPAVVVGETLARRLWPGEDPIGRSLFAGGDDRPWTVVGVGGDIRDVELAGGPVNVIYLPAAQIGLPTIALLVRTAGEPAAAAAAVRRAIWALDPALPIQQLQPLAENLRAALQAPRFSTFLLALFAALALILAAVGVYAVIAFTVAQRTHEIGVRLALGARPGRVLRQVVRDGLAVGALGIALGAAGALAASRALAGLLFATSPTEPATYALVALGLGAIVALASLVPARRAARVDPSAALRVP